MSRTIVEGLKVRSDFCLRHVPSTEALVPDPILHAAYMAVGTAAGCWREKLVAITPAVEEIRRLCGPEYAAVPLDWFRMRIPACAKNPGRHGGNWGRPERPARGRPKSSPAGINFAGAKSSRAVAIENGLLPATSAEDVADTGPVPLQIQRSRSEWYAQYLQSDRFNLLREQCFQRDDFRCRTCAAKTTLQPHHSTYAHCGPQYPLEAELADLTTLCRRCHKHFHTCVGDIPSP